MSHLNFLLLPQDHRKKRFVAVRMESDLFKNLKILSDKKKQDLSTTIRELCASGIPDNTENFNNPNNFEEVRP